MNTNKHHKKNSAVLPQNPSELSQQLHKLLDDGEFAHLASNQMLSAAIEHLAAMSAELREPNALEELAAFILIKKLPGL